MSSPWKTARFLITHNCCRWLGDAQTSIWRYTFSEAEIPKVQHTYISLPFLQRNLDMNIWQSQGRRHTAPRALHLPCLHWNGKSRSSGWLPQSSPGRWRFSSTSPVTIFPYQCTCVFTMRRLTPPITNINGLLTSRPFSSTDSLMSVTWWLIKRMCY